MHTTKINNTTFIHHGSYEGDVIIKHNGSELLVPMEDLKEFIAEYIRTEKTVKLEAATTAELLGLTP